MLQMNLLHGPCADAVQERDLRALPEQCNAKRTLSSHFTVHPTYTCTSHSTLPLTSNHVSSFHLIPCLLTCLSKLFSTVFTSCFLRRCCTDAVQEHDLRALPEQCNAKRRLSSHFTVHPTSQMLFPTKATTVYFKASTKHVPVLLCTTGRGEQLP